MTRNLKQIAKHINEHPDLGLKAEVRPSWSNTDRARPAGLRYRTHTGKGRKGLRLVVTLLRTGKVVCEHDSSETYRTNSEVEDWLTKWERFDRHFKGHCESDGGHMVIGEKKAGRGNVYTADEFEALPTGTLVWVRVKENGEEFHRINEALPLTRVDHNEGRVRTVGQPMPVDYVFPGIDFSSIDVDLPGGGERLDWNDGENDISLARVRYSIVKTGRG